MGWTPQQEQFPWPSLCELDIHSASHPWVRQKSLGLGDMLPTLQVYDQTERAFKHPYPFPSNSLKLPNTQNPLCSSPHPRPQLPSGLHPSHLTLCSKTQNVPHIFFLASILRPNSPNQPPPPRQQQ